MYLKSREMGCAASQVASRNLLDFEHQQFGDQNIIAQLQMI